jgi:putative transposase
MPWMETRVLDERLRFVRDHASGGWSMSELCARYGVTRPTGYKWVVRYHEGGAEALLDRSRAPTRCPHRTDPTLERLLVAARQRYGWGAEKLLHVLRRQHPTRSWPTRSTVNAILDRYALLHKNRRRPAWAHPGVAPLRTERPNQVWPADFKGQFRTGDGRYCYPLTVTDHFSRRVLLCQGLGSV